MLDVRTAGVFAAMVNCAMRLLGVVTSSRNDVVCHALLTAMNMPRGTADAAEYRVDLMIKLTSW